MKLHLDADAPPPEGSEPAGSLPADLRARDAALASLERGWSVVPLHSVSDGRCSCGSAACTAPGKHPRIRWERLSEQLPDREEVQRWWRRWPLANLGVVTGSVSGVVVLDVDPRNRGDLSLAGLTAVHGALPHTVEALTGGGGRHFYFRHPGGVLGCKPMAVGLDLKGDGGIVVCPPSRHASGRAYLWSPGCSPADVPLAEMPRWLSEASAGSTLTEGGGSVPREHPPRTPTEQREFSQLWDRFGIHLVPGDRYYLCPFHPDHRPSLHIDAGGCRFYCFGCTEGGGLGRLRRLAGLPPRPSRSPSNSLDTSATSKGKELVTLPGEMSVGVVGESASQDELLALTGGRRRYGGVHIKTIAFLVPEPDNPADHAAIKVMISGRTVGYLARADAARMGRVVHLAIEEFGEASCRATIVGGWQREHGETGFFGVILALPASSVPEVA